MLQEWTEDVLNSIPNPHRHSSAAFAESKAEGFSFKCWGVGAGVHEGLAFLRRASAKASAGVLKGSIFAPSKLKTLRNQGVKIAILTTPVVCLSSSPFESPLLGCRRFWERSEREVVREGPQRGPHSDCKKSVLEEVAGRGTERRCTKKGP